MPLEIQLRQSSHVPLEVEGILPEKVRNLTVAEIEKLPIFHGNRKLPLAEFFRVSGDPSDEVIRWLDDLSGVHWIGAKMNSGHMHLTGNVGRHLGSEMTGGKINVDGDASDWVGAEMRGGTVRVLGSAGHLIGAAYRGSAVGMRGGSILIGGNVGNELGHTLRRGLIAVGGSCGDLAGFNMLAGTILVLGESGIRHGAGMKRGTIGFLGDHRPDLLLTFRHAGRFRPLAIILIFRELTAMGFEIPDPLMTCQFDLYHGDFLAGGRGEILLRAAA